MGASISDIGVQEWRQRALRLLSEDVCVCAARRQSLAGPHSRRVQACVACARHAERAACRRALAASGRLCEPRWSYLAAGPPAVVIDGTSTRARAEPPAVIVDGTSALTDGSGPGIFLSTPRPLFFASLVGKHVPASCRARFVVGMICARAQAEYMRVGRFLPCRREYESRP